MDHRQTKDQCINASMNPRINDQWLMILTTPYGWKKWPWIKTQDLERTIWMDANKTSIHMKSQISEHIDYVSELMHKNKFNDWWCMTRWSKTSSQWVRVSANSMIKSQSQIAHKHQASLIRVSWCTPPNQGLQTKHEAP